MSAARLTVRTRLALLFTALLGAISVLIYLTFPRWMERSAIEGQLAKAHSIARMTAFSISPALVFRDVAGFEEGFAGARRNRDLVYLVVTDSTGRTIAGYNMTAADRYGMPAVSDSARVGEALASVSAPIESGGRTIGALHLGMSLAVVRADVRQARATVAMMSLLVFSVGVAAVLAISAYVTRPLDAIVATVERIVGGDRTQRAPVSGSVEIANLAQSFNGMVEMLDTAQHMLEEANGCLEARVAERTLELESAQSKLTQATKMEAVGQLAAGVAHDFNNLLTAIVIEIELTLSALPEDSAVRADLGQALTAAHRGKDLTRMLLAFGRKQMLVPRVVDLGRLVADTHTMLRRLIGEDIELRIGGGQGLWAVKADPSQLQQVIMNLVVNSKDAMPAGGTLWIETANTVVGEQVASNHSAAPGDYVQLSVRDTGIGMDESVRAHLFEPFFTTKGVGQGTGLGLATVYGIVQQSGGFVTVESAPGEGATFRVNLPREHGSERAVEAAPASPKIVGGTESVLVVEDDLLVREATRRMLTGFGYSVIEAGNGAEALASVAQHGTPDLLLTDVVMPGISGLQLARELLERYPKLRVLCASGYAADVTDPRGGLPPGVPLIQKPYTSASLSHAVRRVLDGYSDI